VQVRGARTQRRLNRSVKKCQTMSIDPQGMAFRSAPPQIATPRDATYLDAREQVSRRAARRRGNVFWAIWTVFPHKT
jgi:hypothetical protein